MSEASVPPPDVVPTALAVTIVVVSPVVATVGLAAAPASAAAPTPIDGCTTISSSGSYVLTGDVQTAESGDCIRITAPDVVLDGGGHTLSGPWNVDYDSYAAAVNVTAANVTVERLTARNWARGVTVVGSADGVTVRDATVEGAFFGVMLGRFRGTNDSVVTDSSFDDVKVGVRISFRGANNTVANVTTGFVKRDSVVVLGKAHDTVIRGSDVGDVTLDAAADSRIVGNQLAGLSLHHADRNVIVDNVVGAGVGMYDGSDANTLRNNTVGGATDAVYVRDSRDNAVLGNTVTSGSFEGVEVFRAPGTTVRSNHVSGARIGISVSGTRPVTIANNTVVGNDGGISLGADQVTVVGNEVRNNSEYGIHLFLSSDDVVRDNDVSGGPIGVFVERSSDLLVTGNDVSNASEAAVSIEGGTNVTLAETVVSDSGAGIYAGVVSRLGDPSSRVRVLDTRVADTDGYGALFEAVDGARVRNATFRGNRYGLRLLGSANATVTNTTAAENARAGVRVTSGTGTHIRNVTAHDNGVAGVRLADANRSTVAGGTTADNAYGVRVSGGRDVEVRAVTARNNTYAGVRLFDVTNGSVEASRSTGNRFGLKLVATSQSTVRDTVAGGNDWAGIRVTDDTWKDRGPGDATDVRLANVTSRDNGVSGIRFVGTADTVVRNASVVGDDPGIWLTSTDGARLVDVNATRNEGFDVLAAANATVEARTVSLGDGTIVGFEGTDVTVDTVAHRPDPPDGYADLDRHVAVGRTASDATLDLAVSYTDEAVAGADVEESTLRLWRYDGGWTELDGGNSVDVSTDTVSATLSRFGLVAPLGERSSSTTTSDDETNASTASVRPPRVDRHTGTDAGGAVAAAAGGAP